MKMKLFVTSLLLVRECSSTNASNATNETGNATETETERTSLATCTLTHVAGLTALRESNMSNMTEVMSRMANLGSCGSCLAEDMTDVCPCMNASLCALVDCVMNGTDCVHDDDSETETERTSLATCTYTHLASLAALGESNMSNVTEMMSMMATLGSCGSCIAQDPTDFCPCMNATICVTAGCVMNGTDCEEPEEGEEQENTTRIGVGSCNATYLVPLLALAKGDMTQIANLGTSCGPCIVADATDHCPCIHADFCVTAGCVMDGDVCVGQEEDDVEEKGPPACFMPCFEACVPQEAREKMRPDATQCACLGACVNNSSCTGDDKAWVDTEARPFVAGGCGYEPVSTVKVAVTATFSTALNAAGQTQVKDVFCSKIEAKMDQDFPDCDACDVECTIALVTRRRHLLSFVYNIEAEVSIPTANETAGADSFGGDDFEAELNTAIISSPVVKQLNGGVAPTVVVQNVTVAKVTTTTKAPVTTSTTKAPVATTTDSIEFSSARFVSCAVGVIAPFLML